MKQIKLYFSLFFVVFSFLNPSPSSSEVITRIIADVNGEIVTSQELDQILRPLYLKYKNVYSGNELEKRMEGARKDALNQLIERKLVLQEAKKRNIQIDEKDIEARLTQIKSKFDSDEEFYYALGKEGMTADQLRESIREQLLVRTLTRQEVMKSVIIRPKEITDYYNSHTQEFSEPEKLQVGQILVKKGDDGEAALKKIKEAEGKLKEGASFETIAKEYSDGPYAKEGGNMPFFAHGELMKEIEDKALSIEVGQVSNIVESNLGYHIIVLKARKQARQKPLSEVWSEIEDDIYQEKMEVVHKKWVEELKSKAHIEVY